MELIGASFSSASVAGIGIPIYKDAAQIYVHRVLSGVTIEAFDRLEGSLQDCRRFTLLSKCEMELDETDGSFEEGSYIPLVIGHSGRVFASLRIDVNGFSKEARKVISQFAKAGEIGVGTLCRLSELAKDRAFRRFALEQALHQLETSARHLRSFYLENVSLALETLKAPEDGVISKRLGSEIRRGIKAATDVARNRSQLAGSLRVLRDARIQKLFHPDIDEASLLGFQFPGQEHIRRINSGDMAMPWMNMLAGTPFEILSGLKRTQRILECFLQWKRIGLFQKHDRCTMESLQKLSISSSISEADLASTVADFVFDSRGIDSLLTIFGGVPFEVHSNLIGNCFFKYRQTHQRSTRHLWSFAQEVNRRHFREEFPEKDVYWLSVGDPNDFEPKELHYLTYASAQCLLRSVPIKMAFSIAKVASNPLWPYDPFEEHIKTIYISREWMAPRDRSGILAGFETSWDYFFDRVFEAHQNVQHAAYEVKAEIQERVPAAETILSEIQR